MSLADEFQAVLLRTVAERTPISDLDAWCHANLHRARASQDVGLRQAFQAAIGLVHLHASDRATDAATRAALAGLVDRGGLRGRGGGARDDA